MKLTNEQSADLKSAAMDEDWETYHIIYDEIINKRLRQLDPQLFKQLQYLNKKLDAIFWHA